MANATHNNTDLNNYQHKLASGVFVETMGKLAEHRIHHGKLEDIADEFASALRLGLNELNAVDTLTHEEVAKLETAFAKPSATCPLAELRRKRKEQLALLENQALKARGAAGAQLQVLSVSSSGLPARFPYMEAYQAHGYLYKAAAKLEETGNMARFIHDVLSCGWPDVALSVRLCGPSGKNIPAVSLQIRPLDPENQAPPGDSSAQPARSY